MNQEKVGDFIRKIRKEHHLTQKDFALKYGVTYQAVSNWEKGYNLPDISVLKQISKDFQVSIDELLEGGLREKKQKTFNKKIIVFFAFILLFILILCVFYFQIDRDFEFKTISSSCANFNISGSISYSRDKTSIYINHIDYCGGNDDIIYEEITCGLYEIHDKTETEISECETKKQINLENFLKDVSFTIDDYSRICKQFKKDSLYLKIKATYEGKTTTYEVPLSLNKPCNT